MNKYVKGRIHSIESFGTHDGPGIRSVVFLQGCPFRCKYCHNPDTWCFEQGKDVSAYEIVEKLDKFMAYYKASGGGITLSGGEPLAQPIFASQILKQCKARGISTAVDTSGYCDEKNLKLVLPHTDLFLLDIKHLDPGQHKALTGKDNRKVMGFLKLLNYYNKPTWVRHVIVPGLTDDITHIEHMALFLCKFTNIQKIELLPYHTMGVHKWEKLGLRYPLENVNPPSSALMEHFRKILSNKGLKVA